MKLLTTFLVMAFASTAYCDIQKVQLKHCDPALFVYLLGAKVVPVEPTLLGNSNYGMGNFGGGNYKNITPTR